MISKNQIKQIQSLHQKKFRDQQQLFLVEGIKTVSELIRSRPEIVQVVYATNDFLIENKSLLKTISQVEEVNDRELEQISALATPNKVLAVCRFFSKPDSRFDFSSGFSLYLDDIRDPGNFGTIIRMADWFGISVVYCSPSSCELYNSKVIQATMGAFLRVKVVYASLEEVIHANSPKYIYGALLKGKNLYTEQLMNGLIVIGNEANGIRKENLSLISHPITIPSHSSNGTESLNAAMAGSIITSEFFRQLKVKS